MPNRILKESICRSEHIDALSWFEEVLYYRLIVNCDDYGRFDGRSSIIKNVLFPLKENLTLKAVETAINKLASTGLVALYVFEGRPYLCLPTWNEHQNVRAKKSKYPAPDGNVNTSEIICTQMYADVPVIQSESESESESNAKERVRAQHPTVEDVFAYCRERGNTVDAQRFVDYYTANGWMVGKNRMKDWKACVRTWEQREKKTGALQRSSAENPSAFEMRMVQRLNGGAE